MINRDPLFLGLLGQEIIADVILQNFALGLIIAVSSLEKTVGALLLQFAQGHFRAVDLGSDGIAIRVRVTAVRSRIGQKTGRKRTQA